MFLQMIKSNKCAYPHSLTVCSIPIFANSVLKYKAAIEAVTRTVAGRPGTPDIFFSDKGNILISIDTNYIQSLQQRNTLIVVRMHVGIRSI
jgi:hypothetical protein